MNRQPGNASRVILGASLIISLAFVGGYWYSISTPELAATTISNTGMAKPALFENNRALDHAWPPALGQPFPNLSMVAHNGETVEIADFRGKVVLVEPIGMTCAACNAFSGANDIGGYARIKPQQNLPSIEKLLPRYANSTELDDDDIVLVQILLYDMQLKAPTVDDARRWAEHFGFDQRENVYVLTADARYINRASYDMIPGFFLLDREGVLRFDATGHRPQHNLFTDLIPAISRFLIAEADADDALAEARLLMSVEAAYRAIPHERRAFTADEAEMSAAERDYLERLFRITDDGVIERVQTQMWFQSGGKQGGYHRNHGLLLAQLDGLDVPSGLDKIHQLIRTAIAEQQRYFKVWHGAGAGRRFNTNDALVQSSHHKLIKAYSLLKARFTQEKPHNQQSFFDHLCALDFI
jgi:hypothetical protein